MGKEWEKQGELGWEFMGFGTLSPVYLEIHSMMNPHVLSELEVN